MNAKLKKEFDDLEHQMNSTMVAYTITHKGSAELAAV